MAYKIVAKCSDGVVIENKKGERIAIKTNADGTVNTKHRKKAE